MSARTHSFFGTLTPNGEGGVDWETTRTLGEHEVHLELHLNPLVNITDEALNTLGSLYQRLAEFDHVARAAMARERGDADSATEFYVDFVRDNFPDAAGVDVIAALVPVRLWAWIETSADLWVVLDYSFAPETMDHVLSARFDESAQLTTLDVES